MPTALALVLLLVGLGATILLVQKSVTTNTHATPDETPLHVSITNVTNNAFTVTFTTVAKSRAAIAITYASGNPQLFYDVRDPENTQGGAYYGHEITVDKLEAETSYKFTILSNAQVYKDKGADYSAKTFPAINQEAPTQPALKGLVAMTDATPAGDTVVIVNIDGASPVSTLTNDKGEYTIQLDGLRTTPGDAYYSVADQTKTTLNFYRGQDSSRVVIAYLKELTMLPNVTLGQNYSFIGGSGETQSESDNTTFVLPSPVAVKIGQIQILSPRQDESFTDTQPQFKGTALPNATVLIIVKNAQIKEKISSDSRGVWSYRSPQALPAGSQTLTIQTPDKQGFTRQLSVPFSIFASGSQVADSATPSATLTPMATPTTIIVSASPIPSLSTTLSPTLAQTTLTPTVTPTIFASPTHTLLAIASPTPIPQPPQQTLPPTGDISIPVIVSAFSTFFIIAGSFLLFIL